MYKLWLNDPFHPLKYQSTISLLNPLKFHENKINCHCMYGLKSRLNNLRWHLMLQKQDTALTLFITLQIVQLQFQCSYHPSTPIRLNKHFFWFRFIYGHKLKRKEMKQKCHQSLWSYGSPLVVGPKIILQLIQICAKAMRWNTNIESLIGSDLRKL